MSNRKNPKCEFCGVEIVAPISISIVPTTEWVCLECSGANLSDFEDYEGLESNDPNQCPSCGDSLDMFGSCAYCDM